jgi:uncharacterized protein YerC
MLSPVVEIRNREGFFAVLTVEAATRIKQGRMKLYIDHETGDILVETITRNRRNLTTYDPEYRVVFFALDQNNRLLTEQV